MGNQTPVFTLPGGTPLYLPPPFGNYIAGQGIAPASPKAPASQPERSVNPSVARQQVVAYQLGPFTIGADSPLGGFLGFANNVSTNYAGGLGFSLAHPNEASAMVAQGAANVGAIPGTILGTGVNAVGSGIGGVFAGAGPGVGQGAASLGAGIGSGVSAAGPGVGLGVGAAASGIGSGLGSAAVAAGTGVGTGIGAAGAGIGTGINEAAPIAGAGVGYGAGQGLAGIGAGLGNLLSNAFAGGGGGAGFGLVLVGLVGLLLLLILAR